MWLHASESNAAEKVEAVKAIYEYLGVKALAETEMMKFYDKSLLHLNQIPCNPDKKQQLINFAANLMQRES
jgi:geranylgeranyl diphosphate synthase type II